MRLIKKDAIITFVKNTNKTKKELNLNDEIFSIPYSKIMQAEQFCKTEELEHCFIGFKDFTWHVGTDTTGLSHTIKITQSGLDSQVTSDYVINISEV